MNAVAPSYALLGASIDSAADAACRAIAPTWPLDRFIAVNPYWGWVDHPIEDVSAHLTHLSGSRMRMPREFYRTAWNKKVFQRDHVTQALAEAGIQECPDALIASLDHAEETPSALPLLSDLLDAQRDLTHEPAWRDTITHQISQFSAAYFDTDQADWRPVQDTGLYAGWRDAIAHDHGISLLMRAPEVLQRTQSLPPNARQAIASALDKLAVPAHYLTDFLCALLLRINGWAAWCAYLRWQARLEGSDDAHIVDLLAIRLSWECLLDDGSRRDKSPWARWQQAWREGHNAADERAPDFDALLHRALEIAYQRPLAAALAQPPLIVQSGIRTVQAVFCIDVRSEVFRRSLESVTHEVQTMGFAGFFGLPISYTPLGTTAMRPQLPGLLAPVLCVTESCGYDDEDAALAKARRSRLAARKSWQPFQRLPGSAFTLVEALGLGYLGKLVKRSLPSTGMLHSPDHYGLGAQHAARPKLVVDGDGSLAQQVTLAEGVLKAMSLTEDFARIVLLAGHGSQSANNPHAAGLDCGACCGQTGEVNARSLAALLNDRAVRQALAGRDFDVPERTHFLAALHNTTTDEVELFDTDLVPASHVNDLAFLRKALAEAGRRARAERAPSLGLAHLADQPGPCCAR